MMDCFSGTLIKRFLLPLLLLLPLPVLASDLKVATWNLNWLTTRPPGDRELPPDVIPRSDEDFARLAQYAHELNADVVAIEEVDGFDAASKVFSREEYSIAHDARPRRATGRYRCPPWPALRHQPRPDGPERAPSPQRRRHHLASR